MSSIYMQAGRVLSRLQGDGLRAQLLRGGAGSLAIKTGHALLAFAVAVLLARKLGPEGYGVYSFALAVLMLTAIPAQVGVPQLVVRETARAKANGNFGLMRGLWRWGNLAVALFAGSALTVVGGIAFFSSTIGDSARAGTILAGLLLIPLIALAKVRSASLRGLHKVVQGQLPESIIRPGILLLLVLLLGGWLANESQSNAPRAMGLHVVAATIAFFIGAWLLWRSRPQELTGNPVPEYQREAWRNAVIPLALITGLQIVNQYADLIILGSFHTDKEVGIYRAVFQVALLVIFGLQAMSQVLQPHFAHLYQNGEKKQLQKLVTISARLILAMALVPVILFVMFGGELLSLIFGEPFRAGAAALLTLAIGQLFNAGMGSVGILLSMTGHERDAAQGIAVAAVSNVIMNLLLIPPFGMVGAAAASALTLLLWNLLLRRSVRKRLGIETLAFSRRRKS